MKKIYYLLIAIAVNTVLVSNAMAAHNDKNNIYKTFLKYRKSINTDKPLQSQTYFSNAVIRLHEHKLDHAHTEKDKSIVMEQYKFHLMFGYMVKTVYAYKIIMMSKSSAKLILDTDSYYSMTPAMRVDPRALVTISYVKENEKWKISDMLINHTSKAKNNIIRSKPINDFR